MATVASWINEIRASFMTFDWVLGIGRALEVLWPSFLATFILVSAPYFFSLVPNAIVANANFLLNENGIAIRILSSLSKPFLSVIEFYLKVTKKIIGWLLYFVLGIKKAESFLNSIYTIWEFFIRWIVFVATAIFTYSYIEKFTPDAFSHYQAIISGEAGLSAIPDLLISILNPNSWLGWIILVLYVIILSPFAFGTLTYFVWKALDVYTFIVLQTRMWSRKIISTFLVIGILSGFSAALSVNTSGLITDLSALSGHVFLLSMIMGVFFLVLSLIVWIITVIQKIFVKG